MIQKCKFRVSTFSKHPSKMKSDTPTTTGEYINVQNIHGKIFAQDLTFTRVIISLKPQLLIFKQIAQCRD